MKIGQILKQLRSEKGLTQEKIAKKLNITAGSYAHYENGIREPNLEMLKKLANFFDVSTDYLLDNEKFEIKKKNINNNVFFIQN